MPALQPLFRYNRHWQLARSGGGIERDRSFAGDDMAAGLIGEILRDEEEAPAVWATEALADPAVFAAATEDHASSQNPEIARQLAALVGKQARRPETHAEHLQYHQRLRIEYLHRSRSSGESRYRLGRLEIPNRLGGVGIRLERFRRVV